MSLWSSIKPCCELHTRPAEIQIEQSIISLI